MSRIGVTVVAAGMMLGVAASPTTVGHWVGMVLLVVALSALGLMATVDVRCWLARRRRS